VIAISISQFLLLYDINLISYRTTTSFSRWKKKTENTKFSPYSFIYYGTLFIMVQFFPTLLHSNSLLFFIVGNSGNLISSLYFCYYYVDYYNYYCYYCNAADCHRINKLFLFKECYLVIAQILIYFIELHT